MTQRERDRLLALNKADKKLITQKQAAQQIGLSERRLLAKLRGEGDQAVIHAARGGASNRKISAKVEKRAVAILQTPLRRLRTDAGGGASPAAPRRPRRPRNAARLDGRGRAVETPPAQRVPCRRGPRSGQLHNLTPGARPTARTVLRTRGKERPLG